MDGFREGKSGREKRLEKKVRREKKTIFPHLAGDPALDRKARGGLDRGLVREAQVGERGPSRDPDLGLDEVDAFFAGFFFSKGKKRGKEKKTELFSSEKEERGEKKEK